MSPAGAPGLDGGQPLGGSPDVIVVSGLYELFPDGPMIQASMARLRRLLAPAGRWCSPPRPAIRRLELIANVLPNRDGQPG